MITCPHNSYQFDIVHDRIGLPEPKSVLKHKCEELEVWMCGLNFSFSGPNAIAPVNAPDSQKDAKTTSASQNEKTSLESPKKRQRQGKRLGREVFTGALKSGKLELSRIAIAKTLSQFEDCKVEVVIERVRKNRSIPQNKWYWSCIIPTIAKEIGEYDEEEIHAILKTMFNKKTMVVKGKEMEVVRDTKGLNVNDFAEYCEKVRIWAAQFLNVSIPDPDKDWIFREMPELIEQK